LFGGGYVNEHRWPLYSEHMEGYAKLSLKKYRPMAARNEDKNVFSGLL
jgi:hypothetical protein